jgi:hypothetical protein
MSNPALRITVPLGAFLWAAGCAASPQLAPAAIEPGCYAVIADSWPAAVVAETGLNSLPSFVGLDTTVAGPRGRRVILPVTWRLAPPRNRSAFWTNELHGNRPASLVVTFVGPAGDFVASLEQSPSGYAGAGVALGRRGANRVPQVRISLVAVSCSGLRLGTHDPTL